MMDKTLIFANNHTHPFCSFHQIEPKMKDWNGITWLLFATLALAMAQQDTSECPPENISFEMVTGYVYSAPADMLDSQPGTLMLTDCIDTCRQNSSCRSINYETGLCVLFSSNVDDDGGKYYYVSLGLET